MPVLFNRKRLENSDPRARLRLIVTAPLLRFGTWLGFQHIDFAYIHGDPHRLHLGARCSTMNTLFNVVSGEIWIGDDTIFSHNCHVLTGNHRFWRGRRASLSPASAIVEVPATGNDIHIGRGCFIGAGATITANTTIGDHCIVGAGAVVASDVPDHSFVAGVPAKIIADLRTHR